ncbi:thioredoxin reductase [Candidatus Saccharibacteria bacterium HGW-Saccharibacteria-1]|jgi:thioredoxin reductase (NADPH)|nr:MAG: thioredoxin reductase [Candidatus Saccharibacteria bacterium HGW-Saccharibacteria-1]
MSDKIHDLVMIGAGPSALAAAVYTTREDIETIIYEKSAVGGLAATTDMVDNYPGFPEGIEGPVLADQLQKQAERFGAQIEFGEVESIRDEGEYKAIIVDGLEVKAKVVLIATGSKYGKINAPGEAENYGKGVHYCATCDGAFYKGKRLVVVGGGNSAIQEAIFLTRFASHIDLLVRSTVKASDVLQRKLQKFVDEGIITVHLETTIDEIVTTEGKVTHMHTTKKGKPAKVEADGVFVFAGLKPNTDFLKGSGVELDEVGFIKTDANLQTNIPGVFASGDVRSGATMQIACAVGEGATAAHSIRKYLQG